MTAEFRGVRPRARLTGRAGGLEGIDLGPSWAAPRWSRDTTSVLRPRPGCEIHCEGRIERTRAVALTRAPHTAFMCVFKTEQPLLTLVEGHADACGRSRRNTIFHGIYVKVFRFWSDGHTFLAKRAGSIEIK